MIWVSTHALVYLVVSMARLCKYGLAQAHPPSGARPLYEIRITVQVRSTDTYIL